jgi:hypothetical protein
VALDVDESGRYDQTGGIDPVLCLGIFKLASRSDTYDPVAAYSDISVIPGVSRAIHNAPFEYQDIVG